MKNVLETLKSKNKASGENCHKKQCDIILDELKKCDGINMTPCNQKFIYFYH